MRRGGDFEWSSGWMRKGGDFEWSLGWMRSDSYTKGVAGQMKV